MKAIQVKYIGPTDTKPARIKAWINQQNSVTICFDHGLSIDENNKNAARALLKSLEWNGAWIGGQLPNEDYCFVCFDSCLPLQVAFWS